MTDPRQEADVPSEPPRWRLWSVGCGRWEWYIPPAVLSRTNYSREHGRAVALRLARVTDVLREELLG